MSLNFINDLSKKELKILVKNSKSYNNIMRSINVIVNGNNLRYLKSRIESMNIVADFKKDDLNLAYLLGYYDGDGSVRSPVIDSGSKTFLQQIKKKYSLSGKITLKKNHIGQCFSLYIGQDFLRRLMSNFPNSLSRKRGLLNYDLRKDNCSCGRQKLIESSICRFCRQK